MIKPKKELSFNIYIGADYMDHIGLINHHILRIISDRYWTPLDDILIYKIQVKLQGL
jgi:hypothetical protein